MTLADLDWRLIRDEARPGAVQMALDEVAADTVASGGPCTVRVYRWKPSTLSLGYHQEIETIDRAYCEHEGIDVTRRQTGGGGIYHDSLGDISYSIVVPASAVPGDLMESYHLLLTPVLDAFERMGVEARVAAEEREAIYPPACYLRAVNPAHDVVVGGRKASGNAQYRQKEVVIQHGSLTYARETERHLAAFGNPVSASEFEERVTSIRAESGIDRERAVRDLEDALAEWADAEPGEWREAELADARDLAAEKYDDGDWIESY